MSLYGGKEITEDESYQWKTTGKMIDITHKNTSRFAKPLLLPSWFVSRRQTIESVAAESTQRRYI